MKKAKVGNLVAVEFLDHCENHTGPMLCTVYGEVVESRPDWLKVRCWVCHDHAGNHDNHTDYVIVRACIAKIERLRCC